MAGSERCCSWPFQCVGSFLQRCDLIGCLIVGHLSLSLVYLCTCVACLEWMTNIMSSAALHLIGRLYRLQCPMT
jgi:hypothetical protein